MAENTIRTRIQLKYDTIANWNTSQLILKQGEVAIAEIPTETSNSGLTPPAIGIKVGDGTSTFSQLNWIQGIAGDVYSWAKLASGGSIPLTRDANSENPVNTTLLAWLQSLTDDMDSLSGGAGSISTQISNALGELDVTNITGFGPDKTLQTLTETDGRIAASFQNIQIAESQVTNLTTDLAAKQDALSFNGTYNADTNKVATEATVSGAIEALDGVITGSAAASKTLTSFSETDGIVTATFGDIQIAESQVTNLTTDLAAKAPLASPALTGTPTAPTATAGTNSTQIATTAFVHDAVAGLSGAMHFIGTTSTSLTDGATTSTLTAASTGSLTKTTGFVAGDVVLSGNKEFVWLGSAWEELGNEGSYALSTVQVTGGDGLSGGGSLQENREITHAVPSGASAGAQGTSGGRTYIQTITTDKFGHITGTTTATETVTNTTYTFASGSTNGQFTVTPSGGSAQQVSIYGLNNAAYKDVSTSIPSTGTADDAKVPTVAAVKELVNSLDSDLAVIAKTGSIYDVIEGSSTSTNPAVTYLLFDCGNSSGW